MDDSLRCSVLLCVDDVGQEFRVEFEEILFVAVDAALIEKLDVEVVLAALSLKDDSAEGVHQLLLVVNALIFAVDHD
jgi:hypothetical protein